MKSAEKAVILLIKSALSGEKQVMPMDLDWENVLKISKRHQIVPLVYYGIVNSGLEFDLKSEFFALTVQATMVEQNQLFELENLKSVFSKNGICYLILKGPVVKSKYPSSEMRTMSDIDILIKPSQYEKIKSAMEQSGYTFELESDHEFVWRKKPFVNIELHKHLIPSYNKDFYAYFGDGWQLAKAEDNSYEHILTEEDSFLYIFTHFAKHYRDGGIGLRHLTDLYVLLNNKKLNLDYLESALKKLQIYEFFNNILNTLKMCFDCGEETELTNKIITWVIEGGSYGLKKKYDLANAAKSVAGSNKSAKTATVFKTLFPAANAIKNRYPILEKAPFLLPIIWVVRAVSALFFRRDNIKENSQKLKNVTDEAVKKYNEELAEVGLKFN